ncbi:Caspase domain-containing protein [Komarekiella sp. 'clone 1']|uniref:Caspase domain-containing protein n=1 Tax=Komarekiella delphini-convector SJRDD-AB1 TaxID=2593771 RepID=A0AA40STR2_9NOST|nr:caspase family protein [Komarekiella delphini-convector]MBD6615081.1 Caspase domain-containing protein [Komarekiella delphini-convector SJRDD-AB1]
MRRLLVNFICGLLIVVPLSSEASPQQSHVCQSTQSTPKFLVVGGGGAPSFNEIALEKNVLFFQRTLQFMGYEPKQVASIFFANGNDGQASIRYIDQQGRQQFKRPNIPYLQGAITLKNLERYFQQLAQQKNSKTSFLYFTGHGGLNEQDLDNNSFYLWNKQQLSVRQFSQMLDKVSPKTPVVAMMAQCFSGSFANFIYEGGDPKRPVALQTRCGFFATIKSLPSVGCTPEVNEADYRDYSSSFFAGLSGRDRTGKAVSSADYNKDGRVAYAEAHAFAKVDEKSIDLPISTSEAWLQNKFSAKLEKTIFSQSISQILQTARPEQSYVVNSLVNRFELDKQKPVLQNLNSVNSQKIQTDEQQADLKRLEMELINIAVEKQIRTAGNQKDINTLERLVKCESGSWKK